jgi:predicted DNA-binding transcriptional regulator YafY
VEVFDDVSRIVRDDLVETIKPHSRLTIAAACFSVYAYKELKKQLSSIDNCRFMNHVEIVDEEITDKAKELRESVSDYTESVFKMYGGQVEDVTLQFDQMLIGAVYDKFGEDTKMLRINDTAYVAAVKAQISPTFWGWLFQFGGHMTINCPESLKEEYKKQAQMLIE